MCGGSTGGVALWRGGRGAATGGPVVYNPADMAARGGGCCVLWSSCPSGVLWSGLPARNAFEVLWVPRVLRGTRTVCMVMHGDTLRAPRRHTCRVCRRHITRLARRCRRARHLRRSMQCAPQHWDTTDPDSDMPDFGRRALGGGPTAGMCTLTVSNCAWGLQDARRTCCDAGDNNGVTAE